MPVMHACGHDIHVACLLGASQLFAGHQELWKGTLVALFQPAEETGDGARAMIDDGLLARIPAPEVALAQHVLPGPSGRVATRPGAVLSSADSVRITVHGRGGHGSMPQNTVDPVVLAAMIVVRLQPIISRETPPTEPAVLTVGSLRAGTKSNIIADEAVLELNLRTYTDSVRQRILASIRRTVQAECQASGCPKEPEFEIFDRFPLTANDKETTARVAGALQQLFWRPRRRLGPRLRAKTSAIFPGPLASPTPTGVSAERTRRLGMPPSWPGGSRKTSRPIIRQCSCPSSSQPCGPEPKRSSQQPWPGSTPTTLDRPRRPEDAGSPRRSPTALHVSPRNVPCTG